MAMNKIEVRELLSVLESIRADKYPDVPTELISQIVQTQFENQDNRVEARHQTKRLIDEFLLTIANCEEGASRNA